MELFIGGHPIDTGGIDMAVQRGAAAGMRALQVFTAIPKFYNEDKSVRPERVERFRKALSLTNIPPRLVQSHAGYVLNVASDDEAKQQRARAGLAKEMERSVKLGLGSVCFHPGSAKGDGKAAAERVAEAMAHALESAPGETRLLVENTAGAGHTFGRSPEEIAAILERIPAEQRKRAGYGLDTCHLYASGYDIASSKDALEKVLDAFEQACGEPPRFFHLNDSEGALGSNRDRHMLIGEGRIGVEPFGWLLHDRRAAGIPLLLETPEENPGIAEDDPSADPWDARMVQLLNSLA